MRLSSLFDVLEPRQLLTVSFAAPVSTGGAYVLDAGSIAVADFNKDGNQDVVVTGRDLTGTYGVALFTGKGDGTFNEPVFTLLGLHPFQLAAADFNGDSNADVVVADGRTGLLDFLPGNGDGTFGAVVSSPFGSQVAQGQFDFAYLDTADFNKDGKLDVVVSSTPDNGVTNSLLVMLNNGDGSFAGQQAIAIGGVGPVAAGDFDGDGNVDVAYIAGASKFLFLRTDLSPNAAAQQFAIPQNANIIFSGDFNNDGKLDIGVPTENKNLPTGTAPGPESLSLFLNGNFNNRIDVTLTAPYAVVAGDFDGDGKTDIVSQPYGPPIAQVLTGNGNTGTASFSAPATINLKDPIPEINDFTALFNATGDFNNDGKLDVVYSAFDRNGLGQLQGGVGVLLNTSPTVPPPPPPPPDNTGGVTPTLPNPIPAGTQFIIGQKAKKKLKQTVQITNGSNAQTGNITVALTLSTDQVASADDRQIASVTKKAKLKPGKVLKVVNSIQTLPTTVTAGNYYLIAVVTTPSGTSVISSGSTISAVDPTVNLSGSFSKAPVGFTAGKKNSITLSVSNTGNTAFKGVLPSELFASADNVFSAGTDPSLGTVSKKVNIAPGKTVKVTYSFTPVSFPAGVSGNNFLLVNLDPANTTGDIDRGNNLFSTTTAVPFA